MLEHEECRGMTIYGTSVAPLQFDCGVDEHGEQIQEFTHEVFPRFEPPWGRKTLLLPVWWVDLGLMLETQLSRKARARCNYCVRVSKVSIHAQVALSLLL